MQYEPCAGCGHVSCGKGNCRRAGSPSCQGLSPRNTTMSGTRDLTMSEKEDTCLHVSCEDAYVCRRLDSPTRRHPPGSGHSPNTSVTWPSDGHDVPQAQARGLQSSSPTAGQGSQLAQRCTHVSCGGTCRRFVARTATHCVTLAPPSPFPVVCFFFRAEHS
eukprot:NODE_5241_length_521_cov_299.406780_g3878_i0.p2 GENE.NODE_5241_length_521_cov_299.406780_g3878_i0~~NODE_5241_length_521_cov_299.406780_g3878_i0.p2  ORF type:complete len:170 (-),score=19.28 NODE_5241_length_521_cov_299.406780_g3878_i0:11-493(-)